jgi:hypothetical protein
MEKILCNTNYIRMPILVKTNRGDTRYPIVEVGEGKAKEAVQHG